MLFCFLLGLIVFDPWDTNHLLAYDQLSPSNSLQQWLTNNENQFSRGGNSLEADKKTWTPLPVKNYLLQRLHIKTPGNAANAQHVCIECTHIESWLNEPHWKSQILQKCVSVQASFAFPFRHSYLWVRSQHYLICQLVEKNINKLKMFKASAIIQMKMSYILCFNLPSVRRKDKCFPSFGGLRKVLGRFLRLAQISTVWPLIATWSLWDVKAFNQPLATGPGFCFTKDGIPIFCISDINFIWNVM